jgi:uncharacterized protein (TIGR02246 family)
MKRSLITIALSLLGATSAAFGQQISPADEEMMKIRQAMTDKFAAAVAKKDVAAAATDLYTADAIVQSLCPESPRAFGREAYAKRVEAALKGGFREYAGKVKEAHILSDGSAWSTGAYTFTVNDKDGKPEHAQGNWIDMLRREGGEWKVSFHAYAKTRC